MTLRMLFDKLRVTNNLMKHYVCTGSCKGVSDKPQNCQDESCEMHGHPLVPCDCEDGKHEGIQRKDKVE